MKRCQKLRMRGVMWHQLYPGLLLLAKSSSGISVKSWNMDSKRCVEGLSKRHEWLSLFLHFHSRVSTQPIHPTHSPNLFQRHSSCFSRLKLKVALDWAGNHVVTSHLHQKGLNQGFLPLFKPLTQPASHLNINTTLSARWEGLWITLHLLRAYHHHKNNSLIHSGLLASDFPHQQIPPINHGGSRFSITN